MRMLACSASGALFGVPALRVFALGLALVAGACGSDPLSSMQSRPGQFATGDAPMEPRVHHLRAVGTAQDPRDEIQALAPPYPIVLVHGFSGWTSVGALNYFYRLGDALAADGADVWAPELPPYASSFDRALVLSRAIDEVLEQSGKAKVHLIAHSQGGIDARVVIAQFGYADRIASLTTVATPHAGTPVAEFAEDNTADGLMNVAGQLFAWVYGSFVGAPPSEEEWDDDETYGVWEPDLAEAVHALTPAFMEELVAANPIPPSVPFFSVAGVSNYVSLEHPLCAAPLWAPSDAVDDIDPLFAGPALLLDYTGAGTFLDPTPNDGLVTVDSARAAGSTFLGCIPADHPDQIGQVGDEGPGEVSGWDHIVFYERVLGLLRTLE